MCFFSYFLENWFWQKFTVGIDFVDPTGSLPHFQTSTALGFVRIDFFVVMGAGYQTFHTDTYTR